MKVVHWLKHSSSKECSETADNSSKPHYIWIMSVSFWVNKVTGSKCCFLFIYLLFCPLQQLPAHSKSETINIFNVWFYTYIDTYFTLHDLHVIAFKYSYVLISFFRSWFWCCFISVAIWSQIILTNLTNLLKLNKFIKLNFINLPSTSQICKQ